MAANHMTAVEYEAVSEKSVMKFKIQGQCHQRAGVIKSYLDFGAWASMWDVPCGIAPGHSCDAPSNLLPTSEGATVCGLIILQKSSNNMCNGGTGSRKQNYFWFEAKP